VLVRKKKVTEDVNVLLFRASTDDVQGVVEKCQAAIARLGRYEEYSSCHIQCKKVRLRYSNGFDRLACEVAEEPCFSGPYGAGNPRQFFYTCDYCPRNSYESVTIRRVSRECDPIHAPLQPLVQVDLPSLVLQSTDEDVSRETQVIHLLMQKQADCEFRARLALPQPNNKMKAVCLPTSNTARSGIFDCTVESDECFVDRENSLPNDPVRYWFQCDSLRENEKLMIMAYSCDAQAPLLSDNLYTAYLAQEGEFCDNIWLSEEFSVQCAPELQCMADYYLPDAPFKCQRVEEPKAQEGDVCDNIFLPARYARECAHGLTCIAQEFLPDAPFTCETVYRDSIPAQEWQDACTATCVNAVYSVVYGDIHVQDPSSLVTCIDIPNNDTEFMCYIEARDTQTDNEKCFDIAGTSRESVYFCDKKGGARPAIRPGIEDCRSASTQALVQGDLQISSEDETFADMEISIVGQV